MGLLEGKIAFVTGGSRGIGAAVVVAMAQAGATVAFSYKNDAAGAVQQVEFSRKMGLPVVAYRCDATQPAEVEEVLGQVIHAHGRLDILVNNAGQIADGLLCDTSLNTWRQLLTLHLEAAFWHTQVALRSMIPARRGVVLNMGSVVGLHGNAGQGAYAASKAGLLGLTKSVAKEVGPRNIRCNLISPGIIETTMSEAMRTTTGDALRHSIPLRRVGQPEDVANLAVFLASDQARYITGQVISVCGGLSD